MIPTNRQIHAKLEIIRPSGRVDVTPYLEAAEVELGSIEDLGTGTGADIGVRTLTFSLRNDGQRVQYWDTDTLLGDSEKVLGDTEDGVDLTAIIGAGKWARHSFAPRDKQSDWNVVAGEWEPLLWPYRGVVFQVAVTAPGMAPNNWITLFEGYLGDNITTEPHRVTVRCRDKSKRLQDAYIDIPKTYTGPMAAEALIQAIINDYVENPPQLYCPVPSGITFDEMKVEYVSVWDAIQNVAKQMGWFLGYRWNGTSYALTFIEPPRNKDVVDFHFDWEDDFYQESLDIGDADIRNALTLSYRDKETGERVTLHYSDFPQLKNQESIDEYGKRAMQIEEADTSLIDTQEKALAFGEKCIWDLSELNATDRLVLPLFPWLDIFSTFTVTNPLISSTTDFYAVQNIRHSLRFGEDARFQTEVIATTRVVGAKRKWLDMETRPGSPGDPKKQGPPGEDGYTPPIPADPVWNNYLLTNALHLTWYKAEHATDYEIRDDLNWGSAAGMLFRGYAHSFSFIPTEREMILYLRALNAIGEYSEGYDTIHVSLPAPQAPQQPTVEAFFSALRISPTPLNSPSVMGYYVYVTGDGIDDKLAIIAGGSLTYPLPSGTTVTIQVSAYDILGEGGKSEPLQATTTALDPLDLPDIPKSKLEESLREQIDTTSINVGGALAQIEQLGERLEDAEDGLSDAQSRLETVDDTLQTHAEMIAERVTQAVFEGLESRVDSELSYLADEIQARVTQTVFEALAQRVADNEATLTVHADMIAARVTQEVFDQLEGRVTTAEGELQVLADEISAKVSQTVFDVLEERVTTNESTLSVHADMIAARVTSEVFDLLEERVETAEGQLTVLAGEVSAKVSQTVFDTLAGRVETAEGILEVLPGQINAKADQSVVDTLTERVEEAEGQLSVLATEIAARVTQEMFDALEDRVEMAEGELSVLADEISMKVSQTVFDELAGLVSSQGAQISLNTESITGIVARVDNVEEQVTEHASQIQLLGDEITLKVQRKTNGELVVTGIGVAIDDQGESEVAVLADRFRILGDVEGESQPVFAVDTQTNKVYVLGDLIAVGLIRATEVQAEVAKALLMQAELGVFDEIHGLRIRADKITVGGGAPGLVTAKPSKSHLWHFDTSLDSTDGIKPLEGAVATLRSGEGRFGGAVAMEEGTTNLVPSNRLKFEGWTAASGVQATLTQNVEFPEIGRNDATRIRTTGGTTTLKYYRSIERSIANQAYTGSVYIKNIGPKPVRFRIQPGSSVTVNPGEWTRAIASGTGNGTIYVQLIFEALNANDDLDFVAWGPQAERKPFATSFVDGTRAAGALKYQAATLAGESYTISLWAKSNANNLRALFDGRSTTGNGSSQSLLALNAEGVLRISYQNGAGTNTTRSTGYVLADQTDWHHYALVFEGPRSGGMFRVYVDGVQVYSFSTSLYAPSSDPKLSIGLGTSGQYWNGLIDELLILPYAATDAEIKAWYGMGAPFYDSAGNIVYEGAGGQIEMDYKGIRFIRKADNKITLQMDIETGDAFFEGNLSAEKIIEGIEVYGGLTADHIKAGTISYDELNVAYAIVQSAYAAGVPAATLTVASDRDDWNLAVWPNINWMEPASHESWYKNWLVFNHQTLGTMGESIVVQFSADGITWTEPYIGAYMEKGPGEPSSLVHIGNDKFLGVKLRQVSYDQVQFGVYTGGPVSTNRPVNLYVRFRRNAIG